MLLIAIVRSLGFLILLVRYLQEIATQPMGTWGKVQREKTKWLELQIRSLNKIAIWILDILIFVKTVVWF
uniref:Uncharacterized protein n=1 Tax=Helianthus annuus TaxID=4232 RepID=A0A251S063_HELAN